MRQLTVRGIPEELELEIQSRAQADGESLNKAVIRLLKQAVGLDRPQRRKRDLSVLNGKWDSEEAAEFDDNVRVFEAIDEELWK